jgi:hypothetical protein
VCPGFPPLPSSIDCESVLAPDADGQCSTTCTGKTQAVEGHCDPSNQQCTCELTNGKKGAERQVQATCSCAAQMIEPGCTSSGDQCCPWVRNSFGPPP